MNAHAFLQMWCCPFSCMFLLLCFLSFSFIEPIFSRLPGFPTVVYDSAYARSYVSVLPCCSFGFLLMEPHLTGILWAGFSCCWPGGKEPWHHSGADRVRGTPKNAGNAFPFRMSTGLGLSPTSAEVLDSGSVCLTALNIVYMHALDKSLWASPHSYTVGHCRE